jgi:hypothetical protein
MVGLKIFNKNRMNQEEFKPIINNYNSPDEVPEEYREMVKQTQFKMLREKRNQLLKESDVYMLSDFPITPENLIKIKDYRQELRDFNNNNFIIPDFPF